MRLTGRLAPNFKTIADFRNVCREFVMLGGNLHQVGYRLPDGREDTGWKLSVVGKGDKLRQVPVPGRLVEELQDELDQNGLEGDVRHEANPDVAILTPFEGSVATPWSASRPSDMPLSVRLPGT
jgi:hypothetical protein